MVYDVLFEKLEQTALFDLKGSAADIAEWCGDVLPEFPATPMSLVREKDSELMWLGPENWMLRALLKSEDNLKAALKQETAPATISIVTISDTMFFYSLRGPDLGEVMSVMTPLDIHPTRFPDMGASFSEAFGIKALFIREELGFQIGVERSFGPMVEDYLHRVIST